MQHGKGETVGLAFSVVRVLAHDHHLDLIESCAAKGVKHLVVRWIDRGLFSKLPDLFKEMVRGSVPEKGNRLNPRGKAGISFNRSSFQNTP